MPVCEWWYAFIAAYQAKNKDMKVVKLVHNPTAGDEEHNKEKLIKLIEKAGFECRYTSTKEDGWKEDLEEEADIFAVAGGDGTVRKLVKQVLKQKKLVGDTPITLLPLGTANNIAKSLDVTTNVAEAVQCWKNCRVKKIDIGVVDNVPDIDFFLEGFGFGIFPYLMKEMKKREVVYDSPEEELRGALKTLHKILWTYEPRECKLEIDGTDHSGKFYMVEVLNIRSIGPNMVLAPLANPGDGEFEVVLVPEAHKEKFSDYLLERLTDGDEPYHFHTLKGKKIKIRWDGTRMHADDEMLKLERERDIKIEVKEGALSFLLPDEPADR